jgi:hypothetical protein
MVDASAGDVGLSDAAVQDGVTVVVVDQAPVVAQGEGQVVQRLCGVASRQLGSAAQLLCQSALARFADVAGEGGRIGGGGQGLGVVGPGQRGRCPSAASSRARPGSRAIVSSMTSGLVPAGTPTTSVTKYSSLSGANGTLSGLGSLGCEPSAVTSSVRQTRKGIEARMRSRSPGSSAVNNPVVRHSPGSSGGRHSRSTHPWWRGHGCSRPPEPGRRPPRLQVFRLAPGWSW